MRAALRHHRLVALVVLAVAGWLLTGRLQAAADVRLEGAPNFRDLGGYRTADGHQVRTGLVFRSDHLATLTAADYARLAELGIAAVCDLRTDEERRQAPTRWQGPATPEFLEVPRQSLGGAGTSTGLGPGASADAVLGFMRQAYADMVTSYAPAYRVAFRRLVTDSRPFLYHCTGGKDRTGVFSAVLLTLLGVPRDVVFEDYLLSNTRSSAAKVQATADAMHLSPEAARALVGVDRSYLERALRTIDERYGSMDAYRRTMLGLSDDDVAQLRRRLLTP